MKNYFILLCALLLAGCTEADVETAGQQKIDAQKFYAEFAEEDTRTFVDENVHLLWTKGDLLTIFTTTLNQKYQFDGETGDNSGTFTEIATSQFGTGNPVSANYAVYPYSESNELSNDEVLTLSLPATQNYAENTFGQDANTMVAVTSGPDDHFLPFKNVGGFLRLRLYGAGVTVKHIELKGNNDEKIAGSATVVAKCGQKPVLEMSGDATETITLDCGEGVTLGATAETAKDFWIVVPPTTFTNGFTVTITDVAGASMKKSTTKNYVVARNVLKSMAAFEVKTEPPHVPVVYIEASAPIADKETWIDATIRIDGGGYFDDMASTAVQIRGRGNSTWGYPKKPYALKFPEKTEVMGMPKHKRWCLIANYMDRTHMRNRIAYHLGANSRLDYTTRNQYAEFYLNGKYEGLYLMTEQIKDGKDRVNISDEAGFLLEFDTYYDEEVRFRSAPSDIPINVKFPDPEDLAQERLDALKAFINQLDKAVQDLKTGGTADPLVWLDQTSMIDFWIIFELMANHEMLHPKSVYFHKEGDGKLIAGPIWDFDYETLPIHRKTGWINYGENLYPGAWRESNWWVVLLKYDPSFRAAVKARWKEWYPFLQTVPDFIRAEQQYISPAATRDYERWPSNYAAGVNGDADLTFDQAAARIIEVYESRLQWIDSQIAGW